MKEESVKTRVNKLTYIHNSLTYLNQRDFEPYIELIKQEDFEEETLTTGGATDI